MKWKLYDHDCQDTGLKLVVALAPVLRAKVKRAGL